MKTTFVLGFLTLHLLAPRLSAQVFTDWLSVDTTNLLAYGNLGGLPVIFHGDTNIGYSVTGGGFTGFSCAGIFSPPLADSDALYVSAVPMARTYTFEFGAPVHDAVIHWVSFASEATFTYPITFLSGGTGFSVNGTTVSGSLGIHGCASHPEDSAGSIRVSGTFCSLSFSLVYGSGTIDGIFLQLGAAAVSAPVPLFAIPGPTNSIGLSFPTATGIPYQIESSYVLPATDWTSAGPPITGDGATNTIFISNDGSGARFFRLRVVGCQ